MPGPAGPWVSGFVLRKRETTTRSGPTIERGVEMALLWLLVVLLILFALVGGIAVNHWLFVIIVIALVLALVGAL
jgi:hypothetical protein